MVAGWGKTGGSLCTCENPEKGCGEKCTVAGCQ